MANSLRFISGIRILSVLLVLAGLLSCDKPTVNNDSTLEEVQVGRLICGAHLPLAIVEKKYQDDLHTFRLKTVQNHDWNDVIRDMKSGKLAGTFILSPLAMNLIHEGFPGKIVLKADRNGNGFVLSNKLKSIDDLNKQKSIIAVPHIYSQHNILLHILLKKHGIKEENVTILGMPPRDMIVSLQRGEIDGFLVGEPEGNKAVGLGAGWLAAISPQIWKDHMDHVFLATDDFIQQHPEQLQELIDQLVRGGEFIESFPHEAAIMGEDYTGSPAKVFEKVLTDPPDWIDYTEMVPEKEDMEAMSAKLVDMGLWKKLPEDVNVFIESGFVRNTMQKRAE